MMSSSRASFDSQRNRHANAGRDYAPIHARLPTAGNNSGAQAVQNATTATMQNGTDIPSFQKAEKFQEFVTL
jgi:hypothetical protein